MSTRSKRKMVLKNLKKYKTIWHPESTLVYKSKKERIVIGRYVDDQLISLDEEALELCDEWNMKPDESLIEDDGQESEERSSNEDGKDDDSEEEEAPTPPEVKEQEPPTPTPTPTPAETSSDDIQRVVAQYNTHSESFIAELTNWSSERESSRVAELAAKQSEYDDLKSKYDAIKKKFDTMKSLLA